MEVWSKHGPCATRLVIPVGLATLFLAFLLGGLRTAIPIHADPGTLYVDGTSGSDTTPCTVPSAPCATIGYALSQARDGDTILVARGTYTENLTLTRTLDLLGSHAPDWATRCLTAPSSLVNGGGNGPVLVIDGDCSPLVEGFVFSNGHHTGDGGGVRLVGGAAATLRSNWILSNTAQECGGGVYVGPYGTRPPAVISNVIAGNYAAASGGGMCVETRPALIQGNHVLTNQAAGYGGGAWITGTSSLTLAVNVFRHNTATMGGGLYVRYSDLTLLIDNLFDDNYAHSHGGGLYFRDSPTATLISNIIINNDVGPALGMQYYGGAFFLNSSDTTLIGNTVRGNFAENACGGLCIHNSRNVTLEGNTVISNVAGVLGGGLSLHRSDVVLTNTVIAHNRADVGGGLYMEGSVARLLHATVAQNSRDGGGGVHVTDDFGVPGVALLTNTIIASHTVGITVTAGSTATLEGTLWGDDTWANCADWGGDGTIITGTVNVWGHPGFVDPDSGDYHLVASSAAIDAGVPAGVTNDIDGQPRPYDDSGFDIGADEFHLPHLAVLKHASPDPVQAGARLTYIIRVTNTGYVPLHATVTDTLPARVTTTQPLVWTPTIAAHGEVWTKTLIVTVEMTYSGTLTNTVRVTTDEGAAGTASVAVSAIYPKVYLPLVIIADPAPLFDIPAEL